MFEVDVKNMTEEHSSGLGSDYVYLMAKYMREVIRVMSKCSF